MAYSSEMREGISEFLGKPRSVDDIDWLAAIKNNLSNKATAIKSNLSGILGGGSRDSEDFEDSDTSAKRNTLFGG